MNFCTISLQFSGILERSTSGTVNARLNEEVALSCEMYGYFDVNLPEITWHYGDDTGPVDLNSTLYDIINISTSDGDRFIQNGGSTPRPSVISTLRIVIRDSSAFGVYSCQIESASSFFQLNLIIGECFTGKPHKLHCMVPLHSSRIFMHP